MAGDSSQTKNYHIKRYLPTFAGQWVQAITICAYIQLTHTLKYRQTHTQTGREDSRKQCKQTQLCLACVRQAVGARVCTA